MVNIISQPVTKNVASGGMTRQPVWCKGKEKLTASPIYLYIPGFPVVAIKKSTRISPLLTTTWEVLGGGRRLVFNQFANEMNWKESETTGSLHLKSIANCNQGIFIRYTGMQLQSWEKKKVFIFYYVLVYSEINGMVTLQIHQTHLYNPFKYDNERKVL